MINCYHTYLLPVRRSHVPQQHIERRRLNKAAAVSPVQAVSIPAEITITSASTTPPFAPASGLLFIIRLLSMCVFRINFYLMILIL